MGGKKKKKHSTSQVSMKLNTSSILILQLISCIPKKKFAPKWQKKKKKNKNKIVTKKTEF